MTHLASWRSTHLLMLAALAVFVWPSSVKAQESSSADASSPDTSVATDQVQESADSNTQAESSSRKDNFVSPSSSSSAPFIRELGGAGPLIESTSHLRWGSLYVSSWELSGIRDSISGAGPLFDGNREVGLMRTRIVYDRQFGFGRVALQYLPRVALIDGKLRSNYSNQNLNFDAAFQLSPRWSLSADYHFAFLNNRDFVDLQYLVADTASVSAVRNNFLDTAERWTNNGVLFDLSYRLSERSTFVISPYFDYSTSSQTTTNTAGERFGATFSWSHVISPTSAVSVYYAPQFIKVSSSRDVTAYHATGVSYSRHLTPTWGISASVAGVLDNLSPTMQRFDVFGNVALIKSFHRSTLALGYSRSQDFAGFVTSRFSERYDVSHQTRLNRRLGFNSGLGYFREIKAGSLDGALGKYASVGATYFLTPQWGAFFSYAHKFQSGNPEQLLIGTRDLVTVGIRWTPRPLL